MIDWLSSMQQTFEYYIVDPMTWHDTERLLTVTDSTISWDTSADTLGSATIDATNLTGEAYIRVYLIVNQNGNKEKIPLGTFLIQTPGSSFDGKVSSGSMDAYSPLLELKENPPPIGYYVAKGSNVLDTVYTLVREKMRAPVVRTTSTKELFYDFVANTDDTWINFTSDMLAYAKYRFDLDAMGRVLFSPVQDSASLQPVWTYDDGNSSILYPSITIDRDLYGIPNVVEVIYSNGTNHFYSRIVNEDTNSPTSTVSRGREITYRETNPSLIGDPTAGQIDEYAKQLLRNLSAIECTISYTHGYCPTRVGDCVRLRYRNAGIDDVKAKVITQSIHCVPGCPVTEKAVFTTKLWG